MDRRCIITMIWSHLQQTASAATPVCCAVTIQESILLGVVDAAAKAALVVLMDVFQVA